MSLPDTQRHLKGVAITVTGVVVLSPDGLLTTLITAPTWTQVFCAACSWPSP